MGSQANHGHCKRFDDGDYHYNTSMNINGNERSKPMGAVSVVAVDENAKELETNGRCETL